MTDPARVSQSGDRPKPEPVKLPLPPGKALVFDAITGGVYMVADYPGPWQPPTKWGD